MKKQKTTATKDPIENLMFLATGGAKYDENGYLHFPWPKGSPVNLRGLRMYYRDVCDPVRRSMGGGFNHKGVALDLPPAAVVALYDLPGFIPRSKVGRSIPAASVGVCEAFTFFVEGE